MRPECSVQVLKIYLPFTSQPRKRKFPLPLRINEESYRVFGGRKIHILRSTIWNH